VFAYSDEPDRQLETVGDRHDYAALGRAVELRQDYAGQRHGVAEDFRLAERVLTGGRVEHQDSLVRRARELASDYARDLLELLHQVNLGLQAAGRIDQDRAGLARDGGLDRVERDRGRIAPLRLLDHVHAYPIAPDPELL